MTRLSIIVPAFREELRIGKSIKEIDRWISSTGNNPEVLIIVEPSPDKTLEVARDAVAGCLNRQVFTVVDNKTHRGKGYAVRCGIHQGCGDLRMFMDADLSVPLEEMTKALDFLDQNRDVEILIGSRHDGGTVLKKQGLLRRFGSRGYNLLLRAMGLTGIRDTQCGFKFFRGRGLEIFDHCQVDGFGFDIELLMTAGRRGLKIAQIPVMWYNSEGSSFDPVKDGIRVLTDSFRVWRRLS